MIHYAIAALVSFFPVLTAVADGADVEAIARNGLLGAVLGWFMIRAEKLLSGIRHQMAGLNRTMLIEILSRPTTTTRARVEARKELLKQDPDLAREFGVEENAQ